MNNKIRIYIAGKVTGTPIIETTHKFGAWQKAIEAMGFEAVNPLAVVNNWQTPWNEAMKLCIAELVKCDAVFLLDDWIESRGAMYEQRLAADLEIPCLIGAKDLKERILSHPRITR
jgi:nucleoside 2-deoxyribosyltransferase